MNYGTPEKKNQPIIAPDGKGHNAPRWLCILSPAFSCRSPVGGGVEWSERKSRKGKNTRKKKSTVPFGYITAAEAAKRYGGTEARYKGAMHRGNIPFVLTDKKHRYILPEDARKYRDRMAGVVRRGPGR